MGKVVIVCRLCGVLTQVVLWRWFWCNGKLVAIRVATIVRTRIRAPCRAKIVGGAFGRVTLVANIVVVLVRMSRLTTNRVIGLVLNMIFAISKRRLLLAPCRRCVIVNRIRIIFVLTLSA